MALDFVAMRTEVLARGVDFMSSGADLTRVKRWINEAMHELDEEEDWDYLFASTTGVAPLTIADLGDVENVLDVTALNPLIQIPRKSLMLDVVDLTVTGQAAFWYKTSPTVIAVYPVSTATLTVKYTKFGPDLVADADVPLVPDRWRQAIIEKAMAKAWRDNQESAAEAQCLAEYERLLARMRGSMLTVPERQARTNYALDD